MNFLKPTMESGSRSTGGSLCSHDGFECSRLTEANNVGAADTARGPDAVRDHGSALVPSPNEREEAEPDCHPGPRHPVPAAFDRHVGGRRHPSVVHDVEFILVVPWG